MCLLLRNVTRYRHVSISVKCNFIKTFVVTNIYLLHKLQVKEHPIFWYWIVISIIFFKALNLTKNYMTLSVDWFRNIIAIIFFFSPPWRRLHEWSKHFLHYYVLKLYAHTPMRWWGLIYIYIYIYIYKHTDTHKHTSDYFTKHGTNNTHLWLLSNFFYIAVIKCHVRRTYFKMVHYMRGWLVLSAVLSR